jgi:hypothetical protein
MRGDMAILHLSEALSPGLVDALPAVSVRTLAVNGAIKLAVRASHKNGEPPSLGHVPVVATQDGQVIRIDEYAKIFDIAVKVAKRLTCGVKRR